MSLTCSLLRGWNQIAKKYSVILATCFGHFFFFEITYFFIIKGKKNEEKRDEGWSHDFHFLSKFKKWGGWWYSTLIM